MLVQTWNQSSYTSKGKPEEDVVRRHAISTTQNNFSSAMLLINARKAFFVCQFSNKDESERGTRAFSHGLIPLQGTKKKEKKEELGQSSLQR